MREEPTKEMIDAGAAAVSASADESNMRELLANAYSAMRAASPDTIIGVGDGNGQLFVRGSYDSVKRVQAMTLELEELRAKVGKLTENQYLLICLAEECAEVTQRVCKQLRFGTNEVQPGQELTNAERTAGEVDDLFGVHARLMQLGALRGLELPAVLAKSDKLDRYMTYSREQGTLA